MKPFELGESWCQTIISNNLSPSKIKKLIANLKEMRSGKLKTLTPRLTLVERYLNG